ncbi:uncharacterized protein LOC114711676 [Neltuma alba]|uniref:uncharacterized protein LOC114711676 n=1 Tax=Neltuma alba TaxID=207710 RepID=UPI0010A3E30A|nr:uncharacterized protein LOC114711676 [Prosopis alba]
MSQRGIKSIIADLIGGDKINRDNYSIWHRKISYVLKEQEVTDVLTTFLSEHEVMDSRATNHVSKDRGNFTEFRQLPARSRWLYVGNNARVEVKGIGTCELTLHGGKTLVLREICFAVGLVSRFQSNLGVKHWEAIKRIMRYLEGTMDYELHYQGNGLRAEGYSNADWAGDLDERHLMLGYAFLLNNRAISWSNKKQTCVSLSSMEVEYVACSVAV